MARGEHRTRFFAAGGQGPFLPPEPPGGDGPQSPAQGDYAPPAGAQSESQQPWAAQPGQGGPDNGSAVAGFILSIISSFLLVVSAGLSSLVSVLLSALGVFYSQRGKKMVDRGETAKYRGLAQAGFVIGLISLVLAVLATLAYAAILVLFFTNDGFREDLEREFEREFERELNSTSAGFRVALAALQVARGALALVA